MTCGGGKGDSGRGKGISSGWAILGKKLKLPGFLLLLTYEKIFFSLRVQLSY